VNVETAPKLQKQRSSQTLREDVHKLGCRQYVQDADITDGHVFPHKVGVNLIMFRALELNGVGGEVDDADVAAVDEGVLHQRSMKLMK
jgi:hypothetical protein